MNKPVLVVMAAGMGSRYGGMKQIDPVGPKGATGVREQHGGSFVRGRPLRLLLYQSLG